MNKYWLSHKQDVIDLRDVDDSGGFKAYFAAFNNIDRGGDVIEPGAFRNLDAFARDGWIGLNHDMDALPIGYPTRAYQDHKGLVIEGKFHSTPQGQAVRAVVKERMSSGKGCMGSIGYKAASTSPDYQDGRSIRRIKSLDLYEASFVNLPMNPHAQVMSCKSVGGIDMMGSVDVWVEYERVRDRAIDEIKSGRMISAATKEALVDAHRKMREAAASLASLGGFEDVHEKGDGTSPDPSNPNRLAGGQSGPGPFIPLAGGQSAHSGRSKSEMLKIQRDLAERTRWLRGRDQRERNRVIGF